MVSINLKTKLSVGPGGAAPRALLLSAVIFTAFWFSAPGFAASPTSKLLEQAYDAMWRGDMDAAVGYWEFAAEAGDVTAQVNLGQVYRQGKGVPQSDEKATYWYTLASQQGSEVARYNLLLMRSEGRVQEGPHLHPATIPCPHVEPQDHARRLQLLTRALALVRRRIPRPARFE